MIMNTETAKATIKAINRHHKKNRTFYGGRKFGVDFLTWRGSFPQTAKVFNEAASVLVGRKVTTAIPAGVMG